MIRETYVEIEGYSEDMDRPATELMRCWTREKTQMRSSVIVNRASSTTLSVNIESNPIQTESRLK